MSTSPNRGSGDYEIGYGRPPRASQFKSGQSGNPKGRPKGSKNLQTYLEEELNRTIPVTQNGKTRMMPKVQVAVVQQVDKAVKGDTKAFAMLAKLGVSPGEGAGGTWSAGGRPSELSAARYEDAISAFLADVRSEGQS